MGILLKTKAVNQLEKGAVIYEEGEEVTSISIVLKGKVLAVNGANKTLLGAGSFIGVADFFCKAFLNTYQIEEPASIFVFPVSERESLERILYSNKDYPGLMTFFLFRYLEGIYVRRGELIKKAVEASEKKGYLNAALGVVAEKYGYTLTFQDKWEEQEVIPNKLPVEKGKLQGFRECARIAADIQKDFYGRCPGLALSQVEDIANMLSLLQKDMKVAADYLLGFLNGLISGRNACFLRDNAKLIASVKNSGSNPDSLIKLFYDAQEYGKGLKGFLEQRIGQRIDIREGLWEEIWRISEGEGETASEGVKSAEDILEELDGSLYKLMDYGELDEGKTELFIDCMEDYIKRKDKFATDDTSRRLRKNLSDLFYELYEKVFIKAYTDKEHSRVCEMFLEYGYLDERLLRREQLILLYHRREAGNIKGRIPVYTALEWLTAVYEKKKNPSKNEFDQDYFEYLRSLKKSNPMTEEQEKAYLESSVKRLQYEIRNMFRSNCRAISGHITTFVPFLMEENLPGDIDRFFVKKDMIREAMEDLIVLDYSVFYREVLYVDIEKKIKREYIQQEVLPDIILLPAYGVNGVMWQDIDGRKRNTRGRFLIPSFTDASLSDMLLKMFGRFRWELCRDIQGAAWNDIKIKSLTSEYNDYIQFYRKNRDLSEEGKEKIKMQIVKAKNNVREVFTMDYVIWIKFESQGAMRLNKVAREIMATYCPFNKEIREQMGKQNIYADAMARFLRENILKQKEFEGRLRHIENEDGIITEELKQTLQYYKER